MFRQGQLAVHGLAILLGRNEAGISNRGKNFLHHAVRYNAPLLSSNASNAVRKGPVVAGVQVRVDERAGDAVEGGGVARILEVLGERPLPRLPGRKFNSMFRNLRNAEEAVMG